MPEPSEPERALTVLKECASDESLDMSFWSTHTLTVLADAYSQMGNENEAQSEIQSAVEIYSSLGMKYWLDQ